MVKDEVVWSLHYGDEALSDSVKAALMYSGVGIDEYLDFFGFPEKYQEMGVDPGWFTPPLPGMDKDTDYVTTMSGAQDLLDTKKREAFIKDLNDQDRWDGYYICLTEEEAERFMWDDSTQYMFQDHAQFLFDDLLSDIEYLLDGHDDWCVEGSNLNWRGVSGHTFITDATPQKVIDLFSFYGNYTLRCEQTEEERKEGTFTIKCSHHDCPMGSFFKFIKQTGEMNEAQTD
jgi:hypothetical protein